MYKTDVFKHPSRPNLSEPIRANVLTPTLQAYLFLFVLSIRAKLSLAAFSG